jgi:hypothetical protein
MPTPQDRAHDDRRQANLEKLQGKYAYELSHPSKYDHEAHKDEMMRNDESMMATEGQIPESWTEK